MVFLLLPLHHSISHFQYLLLTYHGTQGRVRENICLDKVTCNPNLIYLEPQHGNHFGFYEGRLRSAFSNTSSYTYPARLAITFFNTIIEEERNGMLFGSGSMTAGVSSGVSCGCHDSSVGGDSTSFQAVESNSMSSGRRMATRSFNAL